MTFFTIKMEEELVNIIKSREYHAIMDDVFRDVELDSNLNAMTLLQSKEHCERANEIMRRVLDTFQMSDELRYTLEITHKLTSIDPDGQHKREELLGQIDTVECDNVANRMLNKLLE